MLREDGDFHTGLRSLLIETITYSGAGAVHDDGVADGAGAAYDGDAEAWGVFDDDVFDAADLLGVDLELVDGAVGDLDVADDDRVVVAVGDQDGDGLAGVDLDVLEGDVDRDVLATGGAGDADEIVVEA